MVLPREVAMSIALDVLQATHAPSVDSGLLEEPHWDDKDFDRGTVYAWRMQRDEALRKIVNRHLGDE